MGFLPKNIGLYCSVYTYRRMHTMSSSAVNINEYDAITKVLQHYIDGARTGKGNAMKPAFHDDATIIGYVVHDRFAGPIPNTYECQDENSQHTIKDTTNNQLEFIG